MIALFGLLLMLSELARASDISLVYPRVMQGQDSFRYASDLDSSFIFGQVSPASPHTLLTCNGTPVVYSEDGAFLGFLPLPGPNETQSWNLSLIERGDTLARLEFPFGRGFSAPKPEWTALEEPLVLRVTGKAAHIRTEIGGAYHLFPEEGSTLLAVAETPGWYRIRVTEGLEEVIDKQFVEVTSQSKLAPVQIGNAMVTNDGKLTHIQLAVSRIPLWKERLSSDGMSLELVLFDSFSAIDRLRFVGDATLQIRDILWDQQPDGVHVQLWSASPMDYGYRVTATDSTLDVVIRENPRAGLHGKLVVIDPGHGGQSEGAIGPRGTKEKDVTLNWAKELANVLEAEGATVALTREQDTEMSLPDRVNFARKVGADVMISLHANALPDGENPALRRGTGTYYYHSASRRFAEIMHREILDESRLHDDGVFDANLAVVRPTDFPAILIESAYMMQPDEELLLRDGTFLIRLSQGVGRGLQRYYRELSTR